MIRSASPDPSPSVPPAVTRHLGKVFVVLMLCVGGAAAYTAVSPVRFGSEAKIFVRLGRESVSLDPTATTGQTVNVQDLRENELNSVFEMLCSRMILEGIVDDLGPSAILGTDRDPTDSADATGTPPTPLQKLNPLTSYSRRDEAIQELGKRLSVTNAKKSSVITIFCEQQTPELARSVVQKVIDLARDAHTRVNRIAGSLDFFTQQTEQERGRLTKLQTQLRDLKDRSGIASLDQQREIHLRQIGALDEQLQRVDRSLASTEAERR
jgi:uncharacterized protein involved in exopolysaccharide biosynthesis